MNDIGTRLSYFGMPYLTDVVEPRQLIGQVT
jgi:hypothetical protein